MAVYSGRLEDISIKLLKTAKTTFKNVTNAMIAQGLV
ncbi:NADP oxidoreductase [Streptococcus mitis]|nr:NADP oxidoreductase [Streptococcus mitis]